MNARSPISIRLRELKSCFDEVISLGKQITNTHALGAGVLHLNRYWFVTFDGRNFKEPI